MWPLHYTDHPIFDVGLAAITVYSRKPDPAKLTEADLEDVASFIERYYTQASFLNAFNDLADEFGLQPARVQISEIVGQRELPFANQPIFETQSICEARFHSGRVPSPRPMDQK